MRDTSTTITITTGTIVRTILLLLGAWLVYLLRGIVLNVLTAIVIASAIEPGVEKMARNRVPRVLGVVLIYLLFFLGLFSLVYFFLPVILEELSMFITMLPRYLETYGGSESLGQYASLIGADTHAMTADRIMQSIREGLNIGGVFDNAFTTISAIFGGFFSLVFIIVFSFYFTVAKTGMDDFIAIMAPDRYRAYTLDLWFRSRDKIGLWMQGQLLLGVIIGVLIYLLLTIFGVEHALMLALIAGAFEIIPVFGPTLSAIPAVAIAYAGGGTTLAVITIMIYVIAQQFENHLIYPLVVTRVVGVSPLLIILALIVGAELAGFLGVVLSVPIAATMQELVNDIRSRRAFASPADELGAV